MAASVFHYGSKDHDEAMNNIGDRFRLYRFYAIWGMLYVLVDVTSCTIADPSVFDIIALAVLFLMVIDLLHSAFVLDPKVFEAIAKKSEGTHNDA